MHRRITRVAAAAASGVLLGAVGMAGASASAAVLRAARVSSAGASHALTSSGPSRVLAGSGTQLWVKRYDGPAGSSNEASASAVSPTGNEVFVTGSSTGDGGLTSAYVTIAYNAATGAKLWAKFYPHGDATSLAVSPSGSTVYVTSAHSGGTGSDYGTVAYDAATGAQLWVRDYHGPANGGNQALSVAVSPSGGAVFVTGLSTGIGSSSDYATVAYDAATGSQQWVKRYNGPGNGEDGASSVAVSPSGGTVFVTGSSSGSGSGYDYATAAYDAATGSKLWVRRYNGPGNTDDAAFSVAVSPAGDTVFVTGYSIGAASGYDYATVAYDATTGARLWVARYNGPGNSEDEAYSMAVSPTGGTVFVTGQSAGGSSSLDYATVAYDAVTGAQLWVARYNGAGNGIDTASSVAVSPSGGTVFVTGQSTGVRSGYDYATVAYDAATGAQLWVKRYNGPGNSDDAAYSVAVSPTEGTLFVTGYSTGTSSGYDYATIAYNG